MKVGRKANEQDKKVDDRIESANWHVCALETEISYELEEPNVLLLDMAEASLDGQGYAKEEEILRIDTEIRKG